MTLWQTTTADQRFRMDDRHSSSRQLELRSQHSREHLIVVDVPGVVCDDDSGKCCGGDPEASVAVPALELLAALQGLGIKAAVVASVFGLETERKALIEALERTANALAHTDRGKEGVQETLDHAIDLLAVVRAR